MKNFKKKFYKSTKELGKENFKNITERKSKHMNHAIYLLIQGIAGVLAIMSFVYFLLLTLRTGIHEFNFFFLLITLGLFVCMYIGHKSHQERFVLPRIVPVMFWVLLVTGLFCFSILLGMILHGQSIAPTQNADYMVVLGAGLRGEKPSVILQNRINAAADYLNKNQNTIVIVSGGKGPSESITEAEAMKRGLIKLGIDENRIKLEDQSTSTTENMKFSLNLIPKGKQTVLVTNKFHLYRALYLANKYGYGKVSGVGADNVGWLNPSNYIRECMAVVKDVIL